MLELLKVGHSMEILGHVSAHAILDHKSFPNWVIDDLTVKRQLPVNFTKLPYDRNKKPTVSL